MNIVAMIALADRLMLAAVCLTAVIGKVAGRDRVRAFGRTLTTVGVPRPLLVPVGAAVVGAELAVAALAPWPATALTGALLATALFAVLTAGVVVAVRNRTTATCRCFGIRGTRLSSVHVARNATLTVLATAAAALSTVHSTEPATLVLAIGTATIVTLAIIGWEDVTITLFGPYRND